MLRGKQQLLAAEEAGQWQVWAAVALGLFWWISCTVFFERAAKMPGEPASASALNQRIGRVFVMTPVCAGLAAYVFLAVLRQVLQ